MTQGGQLSLCLDLDYGAILVCPNWLVVVVSEQAQHTRQSGALSQNRSLWL